MKLPFPKATPLDAGLRLLKARRRTREGLRGALLQRGHASAEVEAALERLATLGYLDDGAYAAARATQLLMQGKAQADVERRLVVEGVEAVVAQAALAAVATDMGHTDEVAARALIVRRKLTGPRAARFLAARGFDEDLIARLVQVEVGEGG